MCCGFVRSSGELANLFTEYEEFIQKDAGAFGSPVEHRAVHARIVGHAIGEILAVNDKALWDIATNRLTPHMVEEGDDSEGFAKSLSE